MASSIGLGGIRVIFFFLFGFFIGIVVVGNRFLLLDAYHRRLEGSAHAAASESRPRAVALQKTGARRTVLQLRKRSPPSALAKTAARDSSGSNTAAIVVPDDGSIHEGNVCRDTGRIPPDGVQEHKYRVVAVGEVNKTTYKCWLSSLKHWEFEIYHNQPGLPFCTHDPAVDKVISKDLHEYGFWGTPVEFLTMLAFGPCTEERPFMLDIGANIGLFSVIAAWHGCRVFAFEPLAENNHRLLQTLELNKLEDRVRVFKHAVGKAYSTVKLGFAPHNPGSSSISMNTGIQESVEQVTIDSLLAGPQADAFLADGYPRMGGSSINFVKIDTEGWDVAVFEGAISTILQGRVPHILIEFSPGDAKGTAGCDPFRFVTTLYEAGYVMYEHGLPLKLKFLLETAIVEGLSGKGKRVWEAWFFSHDAAVKLVELKKLKEAPPSDVAHI